MKNLSVVVAGSGQILDIAAKPATTARDVLEQLDLKDYVLSKKGSDEPPFDENDDVYAAVEDGQKLYAVTKADAGR